jgi:hypothetical protein
MELVEIPRWSSCQAKNLREELMGPNHNLDPISEIAAARAM